MGGTLSTAPVCTFNVTLLMLLLRLLVLDPVAQVMVVLDVVHCANALRLMLESSTNGASAKTMLLAK